MEKLYYFAFSNFFGIGPERFSRLILEFGSAKGAYEADIYEIKEILGERLAEKFFKFKKSFDLEQKFKEVENKGIRIIARCDPDYPKSLNNIPDPPICLYVKGDWDNFDFDAGFYFAIVGTRKPSAYGKEVSFKFAFELAKVGFCIVSGMAAGIDSFAHKGAIQAGGKTIAVLGCGVDIVYPAINRGLYNKIIETGGIIVSEFPPGTLVQKGLFIARNRIISGFSKGVLVVEGSENSGSLITARYAGEQGKDVFAIPGRITEKNSKAPHILIKQGAALVENPEEIIKEYLTEAALVQGRLDNLDLTEEEKKIISCFEGVSCKFEALKVKTGLPVSKLLSIISLLEIKGVVRVEGERIILIS